MKFKRSLMMVLSIAILVVLVFLGAQLQIPTAFALPRVHGPKVFAIPGFTSSNTTWVLGTNTCAASTCHVSLGSPGTAIITGLPTGGYKVGSTTPIPITITVTDPTAGANIGYELTTRFSDGTQAGTLAPGTNSNAATHIVPVVQGLLNISLTTPSVSPATFGATWTPPATAGPGTGVVTFYLSALAGSFPSADLYVAAPTLSVAAPADFSLSGSASSMTVTQGSTSSADTITVNPMNSFTGSVTLSTSTLPSGVTASFGTNPTTGTSALTFTASSTAATGTTMVTVTGTSGSLSHTATVSLAVNAAPDFSLSGSASSMTVTQGSTSSADTITVNPMNSFTGSVTLSTSTLPSGVTAKFGMNPTTGTSALTFTASSTATTGTSMVTVTGTSGSLSHTATVSLAVNAAPDFSLSGSASSMTVTQGSTSSADTITVNPMNSFTGSVTLSTSTLPSGVTAKFGTNPTTGTSALTFTASSTATTGTSMVTVTGTSGSLSHTATVSLTVNAPAPAPDFSLSGSASSMTVTQGSTSSADTITVNPMSGFTGSVTLSTSTLPSGVTASFGTNPTTGTSALTFTASSTATTGTTMVTITGTSGTLTHTTTVSLTVNAAAPASSISATPSTLTFNYPQGSTASGSQPIMVSGNPTGLTYTASASGASWLSIDSTSGTVPGMINAKVTAGTLMPGTYSGGKVTITSNGATGSPQVVNITLVIAPATTGSSLTAAPSSLNFTYQIGGTAPSPQKLSVGSTGSTPLNYTASYYGSSWVSLMPTSGTTPGSISVSINLPRRGVTAGTYNGSIRISTNGSTTVNVPVTLTITSSTGGGTPGTMYAQPYVYDPTSSGALFAQWIDRLGDGTQYNNRGLLLSKNWNAPAGSWAGANILNYSGLSLTELGIDYRDGGTCTATAPRFVIVASISGTHSLPGCSKGTITAVTNGTTPVAGWHRVRFDVSVAAQAALGFMPGDTITSITLVMDQGPDPAVPGSNGGLDVIYNIDVNGTFVTGYYTDY